MRRTPPDDRVRDRTATLLAAQPHRIAKRGAAVAREVTDVAACGAGVPPRSWSLEPITAVAVIVGAPRNEQAKVLFKRDALPVYQSRRRFTSKALQGMLAKAGNPAGDRCKILQKVG